MAAKSTVRLREASEGSALSSRKVNQPAWQLPRALREKVPRHVLLRYTSKYGPVEEVIGQHFLLFVDELLHVLIVLPVMVFLSCHQVLLHLPVGYLV